MTSGSRLYKNKFRLIAAATAGFGATYLYYKPYVTPPIPYVPPPFVWESIPSPILKRFTLPHPEEGGTMHRMLSTLVVGGAGLLAKGFIHASQVQVSGLERFLKIVQDPERTKGIITVSNHESVLDDPFLWGVLPVNLLLNVDKMRWVLGAADICYTTVFKSYFFVFGKTIPTMRGGGIYQPGVDFSIHRLNKGDWIHIYPEAKVVQDQGGKMIRFKWGVGRIIMDMDHEPIVIPIWHKGMDKAKPLYGGTPLVHLNQEIQVVFGEPVEYADILEEWKNGNLTREQARIQITQRLYDALEKLQQL